MDFGLIQGIWTIVVLVVFAAIVLWAWSGRRKREFDAAARIPFDDDDTTDVIPTDDRR
ncbi:MAG: cbb3-type cytochrome c oxidase subunit 3 [Gammaproteobacteria bacterium]|nr:cbb3-type cytochrome c oxidase subunit 3 [Gammaproteobacteria bacterium]